MARDGIVTEWLRWVLLIASGSLDRVGGMRFHRGIVAPVRARRPRAQADDGGARSRPELPRVVGQLPAVALCDEIEAGNIRALLVTGGNPLLAFPQPDRVRRALARLDVLAVIDVIDNELTALATHVLPATGQLERADVTLAEATALRGGILATRPVVAPVADRKPVWWMLNALSARMRHAPDPPFDPDVLTDELFLSGVLAHARLDPGAVFDAGGHAIDSDPDVGWVREELLPAGRWNLAPSVLLDRLGRLREPEPAGLVLAPRREIAWSNSVAYAERAGVTVARGRDLPPAIELRSAHGSLALDAVDDPNVRPGVVSVAHGHAGAPVGALTSDTDDVDRLTTMPRASGLAVTIVQPPGAR